MKSKTVWGFIGLFWLTALACNLGARVPDNVNEQAQAAAATAQVIAQQAEQAAATVAAQGGNLAATVQASDFELSDLQALTDRFAAILPDENGNITVTLNDTELTAIIQAQHTAAVADGRLPGNLQNPTVQFTNGTILFRGDVVDPIEAPMTVVFSPIVADGILRFEVVSATVGSINVPPSLLQTAESSLNNTLGTAVNNLPNRITLQTVTVGEGTLVMSGHYE